MRDKNVDFGTIIKDNYSFGRVILIWSHKKPQTAKQASAYQHIANIQIHLKIFNLPKSNFKQLLIFICNKVPW